MATTPKGIYYPNDYNEIADIPEDMKKMAESIEEVFEDTDSDLSDIKEEQTTQNNRLNSLEVDNTTNKSDILTNKQDINNIKTEQTTQNNRLNNLETDNTTNKDNISANTQEINNIKEEQTEQNTNISTNATNIESLQEENENLKKIVAQMPQVTGQGTEVTLENTIEAPFTKFDVEGNSTQETTKGNQLVSFSNLNTQSQNGITITNNNDGSITLNGTSTAVVSLQLSDIMSNLVAGIYQYSANASGTKNSNFSIIVYARDGSQSPDIIKSDTADTFSMTSNKNYEMFYLWLYITEGKTFNNYTIKPMFNSGETAQPWEKFTYGASPNPNYEQPIYSAGENENLFDTSLLPITKNGVTISKDSKGNVVLNGTPTITSGYIGFDFTLSSTYLKADTYTMSVKNKIDGIGTTINQTTPGGTINLAMSDTAKVKTGTLKADLINGTMGVNVRYDVGTLDNFILNPKLEKGNKATPYSPYGMGSINEKIQNKNKMTYPLDFEITNNGIRSKQAKGTYNLNGTTTSSGNFLVQQNFIKSIKIQSGDYLHIMNSSANSNVAMILCFSDGSIDSAGLITANRIYDLSNSVGKTLVGIRFYCNSANINISINLTPMIINNSTSTPYVEHEEQDYSIFVQQPFRSNKDKTIKDKFVVKSDNKKYERHYIGEVVLNGTENITSELISNNFYKFYINNIENIDYGDVNYVPKILCNKLIAVARTPMYLNTQGISSGNGNLQIYTDETKNMTVSEFKTWLENNNLIVNYLKTIPIDLPCTPEQVEQLENKPSTYKDFTIINSKDATPAYLEVSGIYDMNKLITRTEVLESEV